MGEIEFTSKQLEAYFKYLINKTYKILPLKEKALETNDETFLLAYLEGFYVELTGANILLNLLESEPRIMSLYSVIEYFRFKEYNKQLCKREVFRCISILESIKDKYTNG